MNLAESSFHSSSSSDDLAAILNDELETASSDSSPEFGTDEDEEGLLEQRVKRQRVDSAEESLQVIEDAPVVQQTKNACLHPGFFKGLCMVCGQMEEDDGSGVPFGYIHKDLKLGSSEIDRLRGADMKNLLRRKKLILVLDLDHTLLNSTRLVDLSAEEHHLIEQALTTAQAGDGSGTLFKLDRIHMLTKLRPFIHTFLKEASELFEMYIYTMGERAYALEVAKVIDPEGIYFHSKIISQSDCTQRHQKGLDVILGAESTVLILDDTEMVWQKHRENLILMERYHFFSSSCRQFNSPEKSLSQMNKDERESDGLLATTLGVLKRVHQAFFDELGETDAASRDVRPFLQRVRKEVLAGCKVVFSGLYPSSEVPSEQPIWRLCERLGAECCVNFDSSITHVIAGCPGTEKSRLALRHGKFLVSRRWADAANYLWRRLPEEDFPVILPNNPPS
ncbi:C-terminal domain phosphatase-like 4 isoform X2 [Wolffia australiana]